MPPITQKKRLNQVALEAIKNSLPARNRLSYELNVSYVTIYRWLQNNNPRLATYESLEIISDEIGIPKEALLHNVNA